MGLEVSRLARVNNADWHRLLEICALADITLILDEDGVYDPANFNDRLLFPGLKGRHEREPSFMFLKRARLRAGAAEQGATRRKYRSHAAHRTGV